jgi:hypothetical protein
MCVKNVCGLHLNKRTSYAIRRITMKKNQVHGIVAALVILCCVFAGVTPVLAENTIAATRTITPTTISQGGAFTVTVQINIGGEVYGPVLNESILTDWNVEEIENAGATYNSLETRWLWGGAQSEPKTVVYDVTVPSNTEEGVYQIAGTILATDAGSTLGPFNVAGDNSITIITGTSTITSNGGTTTPTPTASMTTSPTQTATATTPTVAATETPAAAPVQAKTPAQPGLGAVMALIGLAVVYIYRKIK